MGKARGTVLLKIFMWIKIQYILREHHLHTTIYDKRKYTWERITAEIIYSVILFINLFNKKALKTGWHHHSSHKQRCWYYHRAVYMLCFRVPVCWNIYWKTFIFYLGKIPPPSKLPPASGPPTFVYHCILFCPVALSSLHPGGRWRDYVGCLREERVPADFFIQVAYCLILFFIVWAG